MQAAGSLKSKPAMKANWNTAGCDRIRSIVRRRVTALFLSAGEDQGEELLRLTLTLFARERFTIHCTFQEPSLMTQTLASLKTAALLLNAISDRTPRKARNAECRWRTIVKRADRPDLPKDIQLATPPQVGAPATEYPRWRNSRLLPVAINASRLTSHGLHRRAATAGYSA